MVLKNNHIEQIPTNYIMRRWMRDIIPPDLRSRRSRFSNANIGNQKMVNEVTSVVDDCLHLLVNDDKKLEDFLEKVKALKIKVEEDTKNQPSKKKDDLISEMTGAQKPDKNLIKNPPVGSYKGCGKDSRVMGGKEKGIIESNKRKRICSKCGGKDHNIRTCGKKNQKQVESTSSAAASNT